LKCILLLRDWKRYASENIIMFILDFADGNIGHGNDATRIGCKVFINIYNNNVHLIRVLRSPIYIYI